jgi:hypothetical protein
MERTPAKGENSRMGEKKRGGEGNALHDKPRSLAAHQGAGRKAKKEEGMLAKSQAAHEPPRAWLRREDLGQGGVGSGGSGCAGLARPLLAPSNCQGISTTYNSPVFKADFDNQGEMLVYSVQSTWDEEKKRLRRDTASSRTQ